MKNIIIAIVLAVLLGFGIYYIKSTSHHGGETHSHDGERPHSH